MWGWIPNGILAAGPSRVTIWRKATADIGAPRSLMKTYRPGFCLRWRRRRARSSMPVSGWTEGIPFLSRLTCKRQWTRSTCSQRNEHSSDARKPCRNAIKIMAASRCPCRLFPAAFMSEPESDIDLLLRRLRHGSQTDDIYGGRKKGGGSEKAALRATILLACIYE